jgi:hypothetical protein
MNVWSRAAEQSRRKRFRVMLCTHGSCLVCEAIEMISSSDDCRDYGLLGRERGGRRAKRDYWNYSEQTSMLEGLKVHNWPEGRTLLRDRSRARKTVTM